MAKQKLRRSEELVDSRSSKSAKTERQEKAKTTRKTNNSANKFLFNKDPRLQGSRGTTEQAAHTRLQKPEDTTKDGTNLTPAPCTSELGPVEKFLN